MNERDRMSLALRLKEAGATIGELFDSLVNNSEPKAMIYDANKLNDLSEEILTTLMLLAKPPGAYSFAGDNVVLEAERTPEQDKQAQRDMASGYPEQAAASQKAVA